jgi:hypothetical protein
MVLAVSDEYAGFPCVSAEAEENGEMKEKVDKRTIILLLAIFVVLVPFVNTIRYTLPSTDDFWMAAGVGQDNILTAAVQTANNFYLNWEGEWLYIFLEVLLNPLAYDSVEGSVLGIEMIGFFLLFCIILYFAVRAYMRLILGEEKRNWYLWVYLLTIISFLNTDVYTEVFYWFVGSCYL